MIARIRKAMEEREEGFTLIELLVVIIIIGILAAIAIPVFLSQRQKAYDAAVKSDLNTIATAEESYLTSGSTYANAQELTAGTNPLVSALSNGDTVTIYYSAAQSYCLVGSNTNHPSTYYTFNSSKGGLQNSSTSTTTGSCTTSGLTKGGSLTETGGALTTVNGS